jgi:hypothetical protein
MTKILAAVALTGDPSAVHPNGGGRHHPLHDYGLRLKQARSCLKPSGPTASCSSFFAWFEEMPKREMHYGYIGLRNTIGFCLTYPNAPSCSEPSAKRIFIQMEDTITKLMVEGSPIGLDGPQ